MKKSFYLFIFLLISILGRGQEIDSSSLNLKIDTCLQQADSEKLKENFQEMFNSSAEALGLAESNFGTTSEYYSKCLYVNTEALYYLRAYDHMRENVKKLLFFYEDRKETNSIDYSNSLKLKSFLLKSTGDFEQSEKLLLESIGILLNKLGDNHPDYAENLGDLAVLYYHMGQYESAVEHLNNARIIISRTLGKEHVFYANALNNLAAIYKKMGQYYKAEPHYLESLALNEKIYGKQHTNYATSLNNLGVLYFYLGNYSKAEDLYNQSKSIREKVFGSEHPSYASSLNNLGDLYTKIGEYEKAEIVIKESKRIRELVLGKENPKYANSVKILAEIFQKQNKYQESEDLLKEARTVYENIYGKQHPRYANNLIQLAEVYFKKKNFQESERNYLEGINILESVFGKKNKDYIKGINGLASMYFAKKEFDKAKPYFLSSNKLTKSQLEISANFLSSVELQLYLNKFEKDAALVSSFIYKNESESLESVAYNNSLFYKGFLLGNSLRLDHTALNSTDSIKKKYFEWKGYLRQISKLQSKSLQEQSNISELETKSNTLEKDILKSLPDLKNIRHQVRWEEIRDHLEEGELAIEFSHFDYFTPEQTDSIFYTALLIRPNSNVPIAIFLFEEKELNLLLEPIGQRRADYVNDLYSLESRGAITLEGKAKKSLFNLIWEPLSKELEGIKTIYFSPSGLLHRINLSAIPIDEDNNLSDRFELVQMNSTRSLVRPLHVNVDNNNALLYGGIKYNLDFDKEDEPTSADRGNTWSYLSGTQKEVNNLNAIFIENGVKPELRIGYSGTEESFKQIGELNDNSPRILHIATHGYFFPDPKPQDEIKEQSSIFELSKEAMMRSGLILSGGNDNWTLKESIDNKEDGILTALEISQLNLKNTELVVLSACETGLGDIQGNEGVYGLQRAFKIAGAKYIIMSLWQVPDKQTANLMKMFYSNWLEDGMSIREAFTSAQQEFWNMGFDPYFWAGFVLIE